MKNRVALFDYRLICQTLRGWLDGAVMHPDHPNRGAAEGSHVISGPAGTNKRHRLPGAFHRGVDHIAHIVDTAVEPPSGQGAPDPAGANNVEGFTQGGRGTSPGKVHTVSRR